jgi:hypothetical protein
MPNAGDYVRASDIRFLRSPPRVSAYRSADGSTTNVTWAAPGWDSEVYDDATYPSHDTASNNTRLTAPVDGVFQVSYSIVWVSNATGVRTIKWKRNAAGVESAGTLIIQNQITAVNGADTFQTGTFDTSLTATDYLEIFIFQNSGGNLSIRGGSGNSQLSWRWVAEL